MFQSWSLQTWRYQSVIQDDMIWDSADSYSLSASHVPLYILQGRICVSFSSGWDPYKSSTPTKMACIISELTCCKVVL